MKLQEIFDALTQGELSQVNIGGNADGFIDDKNYNQMLTHVNLGLTALHTRFVLKLKCIELILLAGRSHYHLHSSHRFSDESLVVGDFRLDLGESTLLTDMQAHADPEYIRDQPYARFEDDILKIEEVKTPAGFEFNLNIRSDPWSILTPKVTNLVVPAPIVNQSGDLPAQLKTDRLILTYRANHPKLLPNAGEFDANRVEIDLPEPYLEPLLFYIASRVHNPIGMSQEFNTGNTWYAKYLAACKDLEDSNLAIDMVDQPNRISRNGWA